MVRLDGFASKSRLSGSLCAAHGCACYPHSVQDAGNSVECACFEADFLQNARRPETAALAKAPSLALRTR